MTFQFVKYQGTGNDFVLIDNRHLDFPKNDTKLVRHLCDRKFGIGADGLILLEQSQRADFKMVYYNSDGNLSTMCGNGGRCVGRYAQSLELVDKEATLEAVDGVHALLLDEKEVALKMTDVTTVEDHAAFFFVDSGSPHHIEMVDQLDSYPVARKGRELRNERYGASGANVNFVQQLDERSFMVRTYERGVEDETLSCGTGVTAVALAMHASGRSKARELQLKTPGGALRVRFRPMGGGYTDIWLIGPAEKVFNGSWVS